VNNFDVFNPTLVLNFFQNLIVNPEVMKVVEKYQNYSLAGGIPTENHIKIMSDVNSKVSLRLIQALLNNSEIAYEIIEKFMFDGDLDNSKWVVKEAINYGEKNIQNTISILYFHGAITVDPAKKPRDSFDDERPIFKIPNLLTKIDFVQTIYEILEKK